VKQVVTNKSGALEVIDVPAPGVRPGFVLVRARYSLISAGTEGAQIREGKAGILTKIREHPEQVKQVLEKVRKEGVRSTAAQVQNKLQEWKPLGYSLCGEVVEAGPGVDDLSPGDVVACAGAGYAVHAELVCVPRNLVARAPSGIDPRHAAFATLGAIALHGVRESRPTLGEQGLVIGLGLVGQLAAQFLRAAGVRVAVTDLDPVRLELAGSLGAELTLGPGPDPAPILSAWTEGRGADVVLVCAASKSSDPLQLAARLARDRARVVLVGDVGLELERGPFFTKELGFSISRSYGPGRYDPVYEEGGVDYPVGYVRWTEGRNLGAVLDLIARGEVNVAPLITEEIELDRAPEAYERLLAGGGLGTVLRYDAKPDPARTVALPRPPAAGSGEKGVLVVGSGYFARTFHLPNLAATAGVRVAGIVTGNGALAKQTAEKYGADFCGTELAEALTRPGVDAVLIATRHAKHVAQTVQAVTAGKDVLVEKPLALDAAGLRAIANALREHPVRLAAGFNRRHAPLTRKLRELLHGRTGPLHGVYRFNAGRLPKEHWVNDPAEGGRFTGEACHGFDWIAYVTGAEPARVQAMKLRSPDPAVVDDDNISATVAFADGSVWTLIYTTGGPKQHSKEHIEVFAPGFAAVLTDYRELTWSGASSGEQKTRGEQKGQTEEIQAWAEYLAGRTDDVADFTSAARSTWLTLRALEAARTGATLDVDDSWARSTT